MNTIRMICASFVMSALLLAQTSRTPSTTPTTRPRTSSQTATTPTSGTTTGPRVTLPSGTSIEVRVNENLSSETSQQGEKFTGTVTADVTDPNTNRVIIPRDAQVTGHVLGATPSGRLSNSGELQLSLNTIRYGNSVTNITVEPYVIKGESHTKSTATKVGGGAALGAIIGAIAGGAKGAAIGAGVGGAAGAGTAAATGKRPAEVQPEALLKFVTSGDRSVTAADQSGQTSTSSAPSTSASQSSTWPEPSRPSSTSTTQSTTSTASSSDTTGTVNSDSSGAPPVMHRRDGSTATTPSTPPATTSTDNSTGAAATRSATPATTTTAGNSGTYGTSNPPASTSAGVYGTSTQSTGTSTSTGASTTATTPSAPNTTTTTTTTASLPDSRMFSARDRRVVTQCLKDNATSLPPAYMHKSTAATGYQRGQTLSADVQRQLRSLPLSCDRELPTVSNDLERVIYGGQVMLIDSSSRVLDVFDVNP